MIMLVKLICFIDIFGKIMKDGKKNYLWYDRKKVRVMLVFFFYVSLNVKFGVKLMFFVL